MFWYKKKQIKVNCELNLDLSGRQNMDLKMSLQENDVSLNKTHSMAWDDKLQNDLQKGDLFSMAQFYFAMQRTLQNAIKRDVNEFRTLAIANARRQMKESKEFEEKNNEHNRNDNDNNGIDSHENDNNNNNDDDNDHEAMETLVHQEKKKS